MKTLTDVLRVVPEMAGWQYNGIQYWFIAEGINFGRIISAERGELGTLEVEFWESQAYEPSIITGTFYPVNGKALAVNSNTVQNLTQRIRDLPN